LSSQKSWQSLQKLFQGRILPRRPRKFPHTHFASPRGDRVRLHATQRHGLDFVNAHSNPITLRGTVTPRKQKGQASSCPWTPTTPSDFHSSKTRRRHSFPDAAPAPVRCTTSSSSPPTPASPAPQSARRPL